MKITGTHLGIFVIVGFFTAHTVMADQLVQKFKNPSFSGVGTGAHYLTIKNQEKSSRKCISKGEIALHICKPRNQRNYGDSKY